MKMERTVRLRDALPVVCELGSIGGRLTKRTLKYAKRV